MTTTSNVFNRKKVLLVLCNSKAEKLLTSYFLFLKTN